MAPALAGAIGASGERRRPERGSAAPRRRGRRRHRRRTTTRRPPAGVTAPRSVRLDTARISAHRPAATTTRRARGRRGTRAAAGDEESVAGAAACTHGAAEREYDIVALAVDITLNRYGDHDPEGRMYVLASTTSTEVREAERRGAGAVSLGLQGDAIQPLVLRAAAGRVPAHRADQRARRAGQLPPPRLDARAWPRTATPAVAANPDRSAAPGGRGDVRVDGLRRRAGGDARTSTPTATRGCSPATASSGRSSSSRPGSTWPRPAHRRAAGERVGRRGRDPATAPFREFVARVPRDRRRDLPSPDRRRIATLPLVDPTHGRLPAGRPGAQLPQRAVP